jgi:hypothetical protein
MSEKTRVKAIRFYSSRHVAAIACMLPVVPLTVVIGGINLLNRENPFWLSSFNAFWIAVLPLIAAGFVSYHIRDAMLRSRYFTKKSIERFVYDKSDRGTQFLLFKLWFCNLGFYCFLWLFFASYLISAPNLLKVPIAVLIAIYITLLHIVAPLKYLKGDDSDD